MKGMEEEKEEKRERDRGREKGKRMREIDGEKKRRAR